MSFRSSFLRCTDTIRRPQIRAQPKLLFINESLAEKDSFEEPTEKTLEIFLRIKPSDNPCFYVKDNILICDIPEDSETAKNHRGKCKLSKHFTFSSIFEDNATQQEIFESFIIPKVMDFINGANQNILAFGTSGSGKTYTMIGSEDTPGVIPRSIEYLLHVLPELESHPKVKLNADHTLSWLTKKETDAELKSLKQIIDLASVKCSNSSENYRKMRRSITLNYAARLHEYPPNLGVWISVAEIYNEKIYDLLDVGSNNEKTRKRLNLRNKNDECFVGGLKGVYVRSGYEAYMLLQYGISNLTYGQTMRNNHSSRSHCIFTVSILQTVDVNNFKLTRLNFCDLAGSERYQTTDNKNVRFKEMLNINKSLLTLNKCIENIRKKQNSSTEGNFVPFRESILTRYFQNALSGKEQFCMIVNINNAKSMVDETLHALKFSTVAQQIVVRPIEEKKVDRKCEARNDSGNRNNSSKIHELEQEISHLKYNFDFEKAELEAHLRAELSEKFIAIGRKQRAELRLKHEKEVAALKKQVSELKKEIYELKLTWQPPADNTVIEIASEDDDSNGLFSESEDDFSNSENSSEDEESSSNSEMTNELIRELLSATTEKKTPNSDLEIRERDTVKNSTENAGVLNNEMKKRYSELLEAQELRDLEDSADISLID